VTLGPVSKNGSPCGITVEHTVWCSQCVEWHQLPVKRKSEFLQRIKADGWRQALGRWLCPDCSQRRVDQEAKGRE
jgi:hypothetical protein